MDTLVPSLIAVVGTLGGSALTYVFQRHAARSARQERLLESRLDAWAGFLGALAAYRQALFLCRRLVDEGASEEQQMEAESESYRLRSAADHALARAQLLTPGMGDLWVLAEEALITTRRLRKAAGRQALLEQRDEVERLHSRLVTVVSRQLLGVRDQRLLAR